jgi:internalin A
MLRGFGVLNPQWVTRGVYTILNARKLKEANGRFTLADFAGVLPKTKYPVKLHEFLLALMRKFKLCHPLDEKGVRFLIPELLTKEEPKLDGDFPPETCLGFIYRYDSVLPEGLLPRFIVETYVHREPKHAWRTGVVLERANCRALVRGDLQSRTITIQVAGSSVGGRRELLGIIREHFERIHRSYERLPVTELVPIPEHPEARVEHSLLLHYETARRKMITIPIGRKLVDYSVRALIDGVDLPNAEGGVRDTDDIVFEAGLQHGNTATVFVSYSHKDAVFRDQLLGALTPYQRAAAMEVWADPLIEPNQEWEREIFDKIDRCDVFILLLSNDCIRSDYIMDRELPRALARREKGECAVVPVVVRACRFDKLDLGKIQAVLPQGQPVDEHEKHDVAWLEVTKQLDRVIDTLRKKRR